MSLVAGSHKKEMGEGTAGGKKGNIICLGGEAKCKQEMVSSSTQETVCRMSNGLDSIFL